METVIYQNGLRYSEERYELETDFEKLVVNNSKILFGENTIFVDAKKKIDNTSFGGVIPDGFLIDFSDKKNPEFYLVEVELVKHSFFNHIFPQITKFFAFFRNSSSQKIFIEKIFNIINNNKELNEEFKKFLGRKEIFKTITDAVENSQNILLILDEYKDEITEVQGIYTDTWGKIVKVEILKKYRYENEHLLTLTPDFQAVELVDTSKVYGLENIINEKYHLDGVSDLVNQIYNEIKMQMLEFDSNLIFNPQKHYISIKKRK